jgi:hypothetical protein
VSVLESTPGDGGDGGGPEPPSARPPKARGGLGSLLSTPEGAWSAAVVTGFGGAYVGMSLSVPLLGPLLAVGFFAPVYLRLVRSGRVRLAAVISVGWLFAVGAACAGAVLDDGFGAVAARLPGAWSYRSGEIQAWISGGRAISAPSRVARNALCVLVLLGLARASGGLVTRFGLSVVATLTGAAAGWFSGVARDSAFAILSGIPPHHVFTLVGTALLTSVLVEGRPLRPLSELPEGLRQLVVAGLGLLALGVLGEPLLAGLWGRWAAAAAG